LLHLTCGSTEPADCGTGGVRAAHYQCRRRSEGGFCWFWCSGRGGSFSAPWCETMSLKEMRILKGQRVKIAAMKIWKRNMILVQ